MWLLVSVTAIIAGYIIGYQVCLWEHGIKFDENGKRIKKEL